ncbi:MAG: serine/threonine protein kinase [Deltaproteobacteria bacterium]|nr:serine/threonine protein kinase [Deltaproteobacteria bacterium]
MGIVYDAWDLGMERRVALKVLDERSDKDSKRARRFQREVQVTGGIAHSNVVTVYDAGRDKRGFRFMAMELLGGPTLAAHLEDTPRPPLSFAAAVAGQVLDGLSAAHVHGVVHRDIKPDNLVFCGAAHAPAVKLIDFGVSKFDDHWGSMTDGLVLGTPLYLSPEQTHGAAVDARSDIWAVGVVLYEMLTGQTPFAAGTVLGTLTAISTRDPKRPSELRPDVPPALDALVMKAMSRSVDARFESADEMSLALEGALARPPRRTWGRRWHDKGATLLASLCAI